MQIQRRQLDRSSRALVPALLFLLCAASPATAAEEQLAIAVLDFGFFDTSGEPRDQRGEHETRLQAVGKELRSGLEASERFDLVAFQGGAPDCAPEDSQCILASAKEIGAEVVLAGAIQKGSSMDIKLWAGAFDVASGERVFFRQMGLRGDTDEAWLRGARFLVEQLETAPLPAE